MSIFPHWASSALGTVVVVGVLDVGDVLEGVVGLRAEAEGVGELLAVV